MNAWIRWLLPFAAWALAAPAFAELPHRQRPGRARLELPDRARVDRVLDGDTVVVGWGKAPRRTLRLDLRGLVVSRAGRWAKLAKRWLRRRVEGHTVRIHPRPRADSPRRPVVLLVGARHLPINEALVKAGLAWHHPGHLGSYEGAERQARAARRGIWSDREATKRACLSQCRLASSRRVASIRRSASIGRGKRRRGRGSLRREGCAFVSCKQRCRSSGWFSYRCGGPSKPPAPPSIRR